MTPFAIFQDGDLDWVCLFDTPDGYAGWFTMGLDELEVYSRISRMEIGDEDLSALVDNLHGFNPWLLTAPDKYFNNTYEPSNREKIFAAIEHYELNKKEQHVQSKP